ncbi:5-(carboxyamino)imidazole ribonucleotide synthase [Sphingosinicella rhizophila]|uniref:N5-carboxyaminoimidazole ribonucleotide synthase n=1 Tax=Sphingosinicella rhizophila TaxID=3050082 RepID=A0ABU3QC28_9SPHN|nr:5-(carboxyamino)imidazole ribonucleotide synthase [Sphingosinicella sp. GR2756]MDT9600939.1 5-(carboxyamino)imidazole ribonucleotide synthase [Sphingosinicella sp. GR2756]
MRIEPGSVIGIVGGGQLGRMLAMAAAQLGYKCHIYAPDEAPPAAEVSAFFTRGAWDDEVALARFGRSVDVATYEFENIAAGPLSALAAVVPLHPPRQALEIAQDRLTEKCFVRDLGGRPASFAAVDDRASLDAALAEIGVPAILKTRRFGYDGKGQARIMEPADADAAWTALKGAPAILEAFVRFDAEFSILLCRGTNGETRCWPAPRNTHEDGILARSEAPAGKDLDGAVAEAEVLARKIADRLDYVGMLAIEFFAGADGALFNEMAPRVHNSGHWTIEGAVTSQFENHIRAICGLPLGATGLAAPAVEMWNLVGRDVDSWPDILSDPTARLHLYGKGEARPGRKMGHVTRLKGLGGAESSSR